MSSPYYWFIPHSSPIKWVLLFLFFSFIFIKILVFFSYSRVFKLNSFSKQSFNDFLFLW